MSSTIHTAPTLSPRVVTYTVGNESLELAYCNYTVSSREVDISRQAIKTIYRFSFSFVMAGSDIADLSQRMTYAERLLRMRAGIISVRDGTEEIYRMTPASGSVIVGQFSFNKTNRAIIMSDIEWGPKPVSLSIQPLGIAAYGQWVVDVTMAAEDAQVIGDTLILGVDAEVSYALDKQHYTTRTVTGRIHVANMGRTATTPNFKAGISQADQDSIRQALFAGTGSSLTKFMDPVRIPSQFERVSQNLSVDSTENILYFSITDREVYRLYPAFITSADLTVNVNISGNSLAQYVRHIIQGYCEAPRDVAKGRVLQAIIEQVDDATGPLMTRRVNDNPAYVASVEMTNHVYRNRIDYQFVVYTPFGNFDFFNSLGITNYRSAVFFPQMTGGSARLFGSGYHLEETKNRIDSSNSESRLDANDYGAKPSGDNFQNKNATNLPPGTLKLDVVVLTSQQTNVRHAVPNVKNATSSAYQVSEDDFSFTLMETFTYAKDASKPGVDYGTEVLKMLQGMKSNMEIVESTLESPTRMTGKWGTTNAYRGKLYCRMIAVGELRKAIIKAGGMQAFIASLNQDFAQSDSDSLITAIEKFLRAGTNTGSQ